MKEKIDELPNIRDTKIYVDWFETKEGKKYLKNLNKEINEEIMYYSGIDIAFDSLLLCELIKNTFVE